MLAEAPCSFSVNQSVHDPLTDDVVVNQDAEESYIFDRGIQDVTNAFQNLQLSSENHLVPCSSCNMFLAMPHTQYVQYFPDANLDCTGFVCPQCMYKGELVVKIQELESLVFKLMEEKRNENISEMEESFDRLVDEVNEISTTNDIGLNNDEIDPLDIYITGKEANREYEDHCIITITAQDAAEDEEFAVTEEPNLNVTRR